MSEMTITAERLKKLRLDRGMTQAEVAKLIGVERVTYLKYENGENKPVRKLKELSNIFGVSIDYLLGNNEESRGEYEKISVDTNQRVVKSRPLDEKQTRLINGYEELTDYGQMLLMGMLDSLQQTHSRVMK